jgi:V/A-type H+-transporting ATPase subunit I
MKKYTFLVYHREYTGFLQGIQELGVVHVIEKQSGNIEDEGTRQLYLQLNELKSAIKTLAKAQPDHTKYQPATDENQSEILDKIHTLQEVNEQTKQRLAQVSKELTQLKPWGDFSRSYIDKLLKNGWKVSFYSCPLKKIKPEWSERFFYSVINENSGQVYFIVVSKDGENLDIGLEEIKLPANSISNLLSEEAELMAQINASKEFQIEFANKYFTTLQAAQQKESSKLDFKKVVLNTRIEADEKLMLLEGWVPEDAEEKLVNHLNELDVYFQTEKPTLTDNVPVKLKNNWFARLFEPIGDLYSLPNYHELDLTPLFAPFFMLFFGFCLGDAGYGMFLVITATVIKLVKKNFKFRSILTLVQWLGVSTIIMGFVSGTFFGIPLLDIEWLSLRKFMLNSNQLFNLALILGLIQIIFGLCVKAYRLIIFSGLKYALSTIGWILLIVGMIVIFGLGKINLLSTGLKPILMYSIIGVSGFLILIFCDPDSNPFISSLKGVWDVYGMVSGVFGDTLSYIRLFALGTSGAILGFVVNTIAIQILHIAYVGPVFFIIFLLLGHSLTIGLSILGAFVHPMRLTFVEFYKNAGFTGGGKKYKPFSLETNK